jgi:hypothetical protein
MSDFGASRPEADRRKTTLCGSSAQSSPCKAKTQFAIMFDERFVTAVNPTSHTKFLTDPRVKGVRPPYDLVLMFAQTTSASVSSATSSLARVNSGTRDPRALVSLAQIIVVRRRRFVGQSVCYGSQPRATAVQMTKKQLLAMILFLHVRGICYRPCGMSCPKACEWTSGLGDLFAGHVIFHCNFYRGPLFLEGRHEIVRQFRILLKPLALVRSSQPRAGSRSWFTTSC